jgi:hypothetical protein
MMKSQALNSSSSSSDEINSQSEITSKLFPLPTPLDLNTQPYKPGDKVVKQLHEATNRLALGNSSLVPDDASLPSAIISRLRQASRLPERKFLNESLVMGIRDVILDTRVCLDHYCYARVKFCAQCITKDCPAKNIVRFLAKLSIDMTQPSSVGALPRLLQALPVKKKLAVLLAGFWLDDTDEVVKIAMHLSGYRCARAFRQTVRWFKTTSPVNHIASIALVGLI